MTHLQFYFETSQLQPPESINWLRFAGFDVELKSIKDAPEGWCERYRCCLPLVVRQGRIYLKGGFTEQHVERLATHFLGKPKLGWFAPAMSCFSTLIPDAMARGARNSDWQELLRRVLAMIPKREPTADRPAVLRRLDIVKLARSSNSEPDHLSQFCQDYFRAGYRPVLVSASRRLCPDWSVMADLVESLQSHDVAFARTDEGAISILGLRSWRSSIVESLCRDGDGFSGISPESLVSQGLSVAVFQESTDHSQDARYLNQVLEEQWKLTTEPTLRSLIERACGELRMSVLGGTKENQ